MSWNHFLWKNKREIPDNHIDDDENGYIDDFIGYNAVALVGSGIDTEGHGTAVSSVALGKSNHGIAIPKNALPYIKILPIRALGKDGLGLSIHCWAASPTLYR